jgi:hypothetical protein
MTNEENPRLLDSMALGFFLCGEHREAVETQRRAIQLLGSDETELRAHLETKLEKYLAALGDSTSDSTGDSSEDAPIGSTGESPGNAADAG